MAVLTMPKAKDFPSEVKRGTIFVRDVPLADMFVHFRTMDGGYARPLNVRRRNKLIADWDHQAVGILLLSLREDGRLAIIDGQHRTSAAQAVGVTALDAYCYIDLSIQDEARLYRKFGDYLRQTARDRFLAALAEGEPEAKAINAILAERGLFVAQSANQTNGVAAVETIMKVARTQGPHVLRETIHLLHDAFGGDNHAYVGSSIQGAAMFLDRFLSNPTFSRKRLVDRLTRGGVSSVEQKSLHVRALEKGDGGTAWGKSFLAIHDAGVNPNNRLGSWPERQITETAIASLVAKQKTILAPASVAARRAKAVQNALVVACSTCGAAVHIPCKDARGYVHPNRQRAAGYQRVALRKAGKAV